MNKIEKIIEYLFYLFLFLLPWQTCWIWHYGQLGDGASQYLSFCLYGSEILLWLILLLALVYKMKVKDWEISFLNWKILDFYILLLALLIIAAISIFFSADKNVSLYFLTKMLEGFALLLLVVNFKFSYLNTAGIIILSGLLQSLLAIFQFLTQKVWASKWLGMAEQLPGTLGVSVVEADGIRWLRAYGSLPHPNVLAGFLVVSFLLLVVSLILAQNKWEKKFLWFSLPIILAGLFFTFSKGAFIALVFGFLFLFIFIIFSQQHQDKKKLWQIVLVGIVTLSILGIIYRAPLITRISGDGRLEQKSQSERLSYFSQAKELVAENWLTGVGLGNYTLKLYNNDLTKSPAYDYQPVHNVYLLVAAELGIFGFIIFILLIIEAMRRIWTYKIEENIGLLEIFSKFTSKGIYEIYQSRFYWFLCYTGIFMAILVIMVFDHYLWTLYFGIMLWWLCLGMFVKTIGWVK